MTGKTRGPLPIRFVLTAASVMIVTGLLVLPTGDKKGDTAASSTTSSSTASDSTGTVTTTTDAPATTSPVKFGTVGINSIPAGQQGKGVVSECAYLAETAAQHGRGLMGREDFDGHIGMVFRFETDVTSEFFMKNVKVPLSIAWYDANGFFLGATNMEICTIEECPTYEAPAPFRYTLEVRKGDLDKLKQGPGGQLRLGDSCTPG